MAKRARNYEQEVEEAIRRYMAEHDDKIPTRAWVAGEVGASFSKVLPAMTAVLDRMSAVATRLSALGDVPDELKGQGEALAQAIWLKAKELANEEVATLRKAQDANAAEHRRTLADAEATIFSIEGELETAQSDLRDARKEVVVLQDRVDVLEKELLQERAKSDALQKICEMINGGKDAPADAEEEKKPSRGKGRAKRDEAPETQDMFPQ